TRRAGVWPWREQSRCICTASGSIWILSAKAITGISRPLPGRLEAATACLAGSARQRSALDLKCRLLSRLRAGAVAVGRALDFEVAGWRRRRAAKRRGAFRHRPCRLFGGRRALADPHVEIVAVDRRAIHRLDGALCRALRRDIDKAIAQPLAGRRIARDRR